MDAELKAFLQRADALITRLEPLLPSPRGPIDWASSLAARWHREGRGGYLQPLSVSLDLNLADLIGIDRQRELLSKTPASSWRACLPTTCCSGARGELESPR
jgi:predicted AAA+ superfamily ATPase